MEAAIRVYAENGFHRTTVRAICTAAGLTDRYFYEAFSDGEALFAACFATVTDGVIEETRAAADVRGLAGSDRGRAMLDAYFSALRREDARARVFLTEMVGISATIDRAFDAMLDRLADVIVETLDPAGVGRAANSSLLRRGIASGLIGIAIAWIRSGYVEPERAVSDVALELCLFAASKPGVVG